MDDMLKPLVEAAAEVVAKNASKAKDVLTTEGIKRWNAEKKALSDGRNAIVQHVTQQIIDQIEIPEEYAKKAGIIYAEKIIREQTIIDKIWGKTKRLLQRTPKDDTDPNHKIGDISDDWLNQFRDVACKKSSEEAQDLFSKVLEGEVRKPGSFSLRALTTLSDMDQNVAMIFKAFCSLCLVNLDNPRMYHLTQSKSHFKIMDARIPILNGGINDAGTVKPINPSILNKFTDRSEAIYKEYGFNFPEFQLLKECGIIEDSSLMVYNHFWYNNELWSFILPSTNVLKSQEDIQEIRISGYALTSVGKELFQITKLDPPSQYFEKISDFLQELYSTKLYKYPKHQKKSSSEESAVSTN